jgi:regulator of RNase E activity RraA
MASVVPKAYAAEVLEKVRARREKEKKVVEGIQAGKTLFEIIGLGKSPADAKLPVFDSAWDD